MLEVRGPGYRCCDGLSRRSFLKVGFLGLAGLTLADHLRFKARAQERGQQTRDTAVILLLLGGGPSHIDMYDLKPDAPAEFRGEFRPIATNVAGIRIGEHLPRQARLMDKMSVVRSGTHTNAGHGMGAHWMLTGYVPTIEINDHLNPSCGSLVPRLPRRAPVACAPPPPPARPPMCARPLRRHAPMRVARAAPTSRSRPPAIRAAPASRCAPCASCRAWT